MASIKLFNSSVTFYLYNKKSIYNDLTRSTGNELEYIDNKICIKALENINLEIKQGERVGIIGYNGAGKSTLLKVISGIYEPTNGFIEVNGSSFALTDITMGMDLESSGYENIIMRCMFMGMSFREAKTKVKEIVDFSELNEYIQLPVRTYSNGMYLRLAFTVATALTPDILIIDEVIEAGDSAFAKKARLRLIELIKRTKIAVISSHNIPMMSSICSRGLWMEKGKIRMDSGIDDTIMAYKNFINEKK